MRRFRPLVLVLVLVLFGVLILVWLSRPIHYSGSNLTLLLRLEKDTVELIDSTVSADLPRFEDLRPLTLTQSSVAKRPPPIGAEELVLAWAPPSGPSTEVHRQSLRLPDHADWLDDENRTRGGEFDRPVKYIRLRVRVPEEEATLDLVRSRVVRDADGSPRLEASLLSRTRPVRYPRWAFWNNSKPTQHLPSIPGLPPIKPVDIRVLRRKPLPWLSCPGEENLPRDGYFVSVDTLKPCQPPASGTVVPYDGCLDIVFVSAGFLESELGTFEQRVSDLRQEVFESLKPYSELQPWVALHILRVASTASGIEGCNKPEEHHKATYFGLIGEFPYPDQPGILESPSPCRVWEEIQAHVPEAEVAIFIANCPKLGGRAPLRQHITYLTSPPAQAADIAAHELGHAIAELGEEYTFCHQPNPNYDLPPNVWKHVVPHPNPAPTPGPEQSPPPKPPTEATASAANASETPTAAATPAAADAMPPWSALLRPAEIQDNHLRCLWPYDDSYDDHQNCLLNTPLGTSCENALGAFWGASYALEDCQPPADCPPPCFECDPGCDAFCDGRGRDYFRPMFGCRLRAFEKYDGYCPVCCRAIAHRLSPALATSELPDPTTGELPLDLILKRYRGTGASQPAELCDQAP